MTPDQFQRWEDFALRAARTWYETHRRPSAAQIVEVVEEFFGDCRTGGYAIDPECWCSIRNWDNCDPYPPGHKYAEFKDFRGEPEHPPLLCDLMSDYEEVWMEDYWEDMNSVEWERRRDQWCDPPVCCIRAGFDLAVAQSMGVLGFTAGDIRAMYPDGVPAWVQNGDWTAQSFAEHPVGLKPVDEPHDPKAFSALPDDAQVWL